MPELVFPLISRRRVLGVAFGGMRSLRRGTGSDVAGSRPYRPGDPIDHIDWAASARLSLARGSDEFVVREHYADESPRVIVVVDRAPTMGIAPPPRGRLHKPQALTAALSVIASSAGASRSLLGYFDWDGSAPVWRAPRSEHQAAPPASREFHAAEDNVERALATLGRNSRDVPRGSFVFVLSDFLSGPSRTAWRSALEHEWDLVPVVIQDPLWERSFPDVSGIVVRFSEPGSGAARHVRLSQSEAAQQRLENERRWATLVADFRALGVDPVVLSSGDPAAIASDFLGWADERMYARGGR